MKDFDKARFEPDDDDRPSTLVVAEVFYCVRGFGHKMELDNGPVPSSFVRALCTKTKGECKFCNLSWALHHTLEHEGRASSAVDNSGASNQEALNKFLHVRVAQCGL